MDLPAQPLRKSSPRTERAQVSSRVPVNSSRALWADMSWSSAERSCLKLYTSDQTEGKKADKNSCCSEEKSHSSSVCCSTSYDGSDNSSDSTYHTSDGSSVSSEDSELTSDGYLKCLAVLDGNPSLLPEDVSL